MLVIVEGIDKAGKSTLVNELTRLLGANVSAMHASKPKDHPLVEYETSLLDYHPATVTHLLLDRWHLGERVWPFVFNRPTVYDHIMHRHVELFLVSRGALLVLAEGRETAIASRVDEGDYFDPKQISDILLRFKTASKDSLLARAYYDLERDDVTDFAYCAMKGAYQLEFEVAAINGLTQNWLGYPRPRIMFVSGGMSVFPPFFPMKGTPGYEVVANLPQGPIALVASHTVTGDEEPLTDIWHAMGRPTIVAVGPVAEHAIGPLPHGYAPEPGETSFPKTSKTYAHLLYRAGLGLDTRKDKA